MDAKRTQLVVIFLTVFIYLVGFGVIIPILPLLAKNFGASGLQVGLLLSAYSLMQFIFSPFWGRLSDRMGRRPIILYCMLGEFFTYLIFAFARSYELLLFARLLAGFFGASISTASAYISDITPQHQRSKGMALIGVAFGLGFLVGPAIGGGLSIWGAAISPEPFFNTTFAAIGVSLLCLFNFIFGFKYLTESLKVKNSVSSLQNRFVKLFLILKKDVLGSAIFIFFLSSLAMSSMEATLVLLVNEKFNWTIKEVSFGFAYVGLIMVISQGGIVRRVLPKFGERKILFFGLMTMILGFLGISLSEQIWQLGIAQTLLAFGYSFTNPASMGSISLLASAEEQGEILGTAQSTASLGRIIGPAIGGVLFQYIGIASPFLFSASLVVVALGLLIKIFNFFPNAALLKEE